MKWTRTGSAYVMFATIAAPQATAGQVYPPNTVVPLDSSVVTVTGTAQIYVAPERAVVWLQVVSEGASAESAALANGEARASVVDALRPLGFGDDQIGLWGFGTGPVPMRYGPPAASPNGSDYEAKAGLRVVVEPIARLDAVVSTALLAGASVSRVEFESSRSETARREAAALAVAQARSEAEAIAEAAGGRLGPLLRLNSGPGPIGDYWLVPYRAAGIEEGVNLSPAESVERATIQATWAFESR